MVAISNKFFRALDVFGEALAILMLLAGFVAVALSVFSRYVFVTPIPWTVEVARFGFIWLSLAGISVTERRRAHFSMDFVVDLMPGGVQRVLFILRECIIFAVLVLLLVQGIKFGRIGANSLSPVLEIPLEYIYLALPVSVALTIVNRLRVVAEDLRDGAMSGLHPDRMAQGHSTGESE